MEERKPFKTMQIQWGGVGRGLLVFDLWGKRRGSRFSGRFSDRPTFYLRNLYLYVGKRCRALQQVLYVMLCTANGNRHKNAPPIQATSEYIIYFGTRSACC